MEVDVDNNDTVAVILSSSPIGDFILFINKMSVQPVVDNKLGQTLDVFIDKLNMEERFLSNGIFKVKFAEAGLFLQSAVELYVKKVDLLWTNTLQYQRQLCANIQNDEDVSSEANNLTRHTIRKSRTNTLPNKDTITSTAVDLLKQQVMKAEKLLEKVPDDSESCRQLRDEWAMATKQDENSRPTRVEIIEAELKYKNSNERTTEYIDIDRLVWNFSIFDLNTKSRLCNDDDILTNYHPLSIISAGPTSIKNKQGRSESMQLDDEVRSFYFRAFVNITRIPQNVMHDLTDSNESLKQMAIQRCMARCERTASQASFQNSDSLFSDDQGYSSTPTPYVCSDIQSRSVRKSDGDSGVDCSQLLSSGLTDAKEIENRDYNNISVIPEVDEGMDQTIAEPGIAMTIPEIPTVEGKTNPKLEILNFSGIFRPTVSSTPKKSMPIVILERLSRKRQLQLDSKSLINKPKPSKRAACGRWLKTFIACEREFEKFHNMNYNTMPGEGVIEPWVDDDISEDRDDNDTEIELAEQDESKFEFCKNIVFGIINNFTDDVPSVEIMEELPAIDACNNIPYISKELNNNIEEKINSEIVFNQKVPASDHIQRKLTMDDWRIFIDPILNKAESRRKFNIHKYGTKLMDAIPKDTNLPFKDMVMGQNAGEVARYFFASLQLANTYNIELIDTCPGKLANDNLKMKLLTRDRYHEHFDEYEAPSVNAYQEKLAHVNAIHRPSTSQNYFSSEVNQPSTSNQYKQKHIYNHKIFKFK